MKTNTKSSAEVLRQNAEELVNDMPQKAVTKVSESETLRLLHELQVHQIELEMQNHELQQAIKSAELATEKFTDLYDFAPMGYYTLSKESNIDELNLCGAKMLGKDRMQLKNRRFGRFVNDDSKELFSEFLDKTFTTKHQEECEVLIDCNPAVYLLLTGIISENEAECLITALDITELTLDRELLSEREKRYRFLFIRNPLPMWIYDLETLAFLEVNDAAITHYGYSKEEFMLMTLNDICTKSSVSTLIQELNKTSYGISDIGEWKHVKKNGEIMVVEIRHLSLTYNGRPARQVIIQDVTARRELEKATEKKTEEFLFHHRLFQGRELRMIELKKEINELLEDVGLEKRYFKVD